MIDKTCTFCSQVIPNAPRIYEDDYCIGVVPLEQYTVGHSLIILKNHREDIADTSLTEAELCAFIKAVHHWASILKERHKCERVYACILCDSVHHLHAHLIPRYPFTREDIAQYRIRLADRYTPAQIEAQIKQKDLGGFWYIAQREEGWIIK